MSFPGTMVFESEPDRECWHEAGHAVVAHHFGMTVLAIGFSWPSGLNGEPYPSSWIPTDGFDKEQVAVELFAGMAAELLKLGDHDVSARKSDVHQWQGLGCVSPPEHYISNATDILKQRNAALMRVHERLMQERVKPSYEKFQDTVDHMWKLRHLTHEDFEALM
jgi:hypothetical protein